MVVKLLWTCEEALVMFCRARLEGRVLWALYLWRVRPAACTAWGLSVGNSRGQSGHIWSSFSGGSTGRGEKEGLKVNSAM